MPVVKRVLIAYSRWSTFVPTTLEYVMALKNFSDYEVHFVHVTHDARMSFDFNSYDVVFQNYCVRLCFDGYVSPHYQSAMLNFRGLKIISVQDDYDRTSSTHRAIRQLGFHVLLTCIQREFWSFAYPRSELPGVTIIQCLTGYMPETVHDKQLPYTPLCDRCIHIAYRGRDIGARYGALGFDKFEIGRRMKNFCEERGVRHDIAMDDASRIYGDAWFEFLGSSRAILGSESGSNVFDFDGVVERRVDDFVKEHGRPPTYPELKDFLDPIEAPFNVGQISPRVFETAVMKTPMILYRGNYSGAIKPEVHYIPLEKDFSNIDAVIDDVNNIAKLEKIADAAYQHLVASGDFGYKSFARLLIETIEDQHPRWVDSEWIAYRQATAQSGYLGKQLEPREKIAYDLLSELPTELPGTLAEAQNKQANLARALHNFDSKGVVARLAIAEVSRRRKLTIIQSAWHLLPQKVRYKIGDLLPF